MGGAGGSVFVTGAQPVRQPGDGSCLFHSMNHGLRLLEPEEFSGAVTYRVNWRGRSACEATSRGGS